MRKVRETKATYVTQSERTVALPSSVMDDLNEIARWEETPVEEAIKKAVAHYRSELSRHKISDEAELYKRKHSRLRAKYMGKFIAMHNGRVVDHDRDGGALYWRVRKRFGRMPVLIRQVTDEPEREIRTHGLRLERRIVK